MNNNKIRSFLLSGIFLTFIGLRDIEHFNVFYEGIALGLGITALALAGVAYKKKIDQEEKWQHMHEFLLEKGITRVTLSHLIHQEQ